MKSQNYFKILKTWRARHQLALDNMDQSIAKLKLEHQEATDSLNETIEGKKKLILQSQRNY